MIDNECKGGKIDPRSVKFFAKRVFAATHAGSENLRVAAIITWSYRKLKTKAYYRRPYALHEEARRFYELILALVARDFISKYRRSVLGPLWAVIRPAVYMVVFRFIQGAFGISTGTVNPVVFTFAALVPWTFFSNAAMQSGSSIYGNAAILKKIDVPPTVFPVVGMLLALVDFLLSFLILAVLLFYFEVPVGLNILWVFPLTALTAFCGLGVGLLMAAVGSYKQDVLMAAGYVMHLWMLATPIFYRTQDVVGDRWRLLYKLNPMVGIVEGFRMAVAEGRPPDAEPLMLSLAGIALLWAVAYPLYRNLSRYFADVF